MLVMMMHGRPNSSGLNDFCVGRPIQKSPRSMDRYTRQVDSKGGNSKLRGPAIKSSNRPTLIMNARVRVALAEQGNAYRQARDGRISLVRLDQQANERQMRCQN